MSATPTPTGHTYRCSDCRAEITADEAYRRWSALGRYLCSHCADTQRRVWAVALGLCPHGYSKGPWSRCAECVIEARLQSGACPGCGASGGASVCHGCTAGEPQEEGR